MKDYSKLNVYLSNLAVLNVNFHNLHWNVEGERFKEVHEYLEEQYDEFFEQYDAVAELLKMKGEKPLVKLTDYLKIATIHELDKDKFTGLEAIQVAYDSIKDMNNLAIEIRNDADDEGDFGVVAVFEDYVAGFAKQLWFMKSMLA
ncbi:MAG TPA: DNA starvation/stationary phase protection protein [Clostridiaceae bacterium]|nr:DNA starvation/stationary phase protection protein [Clostridiaceae bacterium]